MILAGVFAASTVSAIAAAITLSTTCAHAGRCGECYNTGYAGIRVGAYDCAPCFKPEQLAEGHDGIPGPRVPKKRPYLTASFDPGRIGGPGTTGAAGTRNS